MRSRTRTRALRARPRCNPRPRRSTALGRFDVGRRLPTWFGRPADPVFGEAVGVIVDWLGGTAS